MMEERKVGVGYFKSTLEMRKLVKQALDNDRISYGPLSESLEREFSSIHMMDYAVLSASGTDSLRTALHALMILYGWKPGDEVIVPATTFVATINVVEQLDLVPVLVDVEPDFYCIDLEQIKQAVTADTRAVIAVNLLGQAANLSAISAFTAEEGMHLVEDSCETMFVNHMGYPVGSWSTVSAFSFYMAHLVTAGVGGIALTNFPQISVIMRSLVNHGRSPSYISIDDDDDLPNDELADVIRQRYAFMYPGYSSRITELQAALALPQLRDYEDMMATRYSIASMLTDGLRKHAGRLQLPAEREQGEHAYMMYGIRMRDGESKWPLMLHLETHGIETREMLPIVNQKMYRPVVADAKKRGFDLPVSFDLIRTGFYIGCHQGMTGDDVDYVCHVVDDFFGG